ncbi:uroporphyrinogen-III C-methyltransferase [Lysobacter koreensis]|uniref:Uroporphyrinogen-III C-methyltransferase n=1 Tax=Lysobacter koreensis TaxID=266122 RepID=A0ABW2YSW2_9GAMM
MPDPASPTSTPSPARTSPRRAASPWPWLLLVLALAGAGWYGWQQWQACDARERHALADAEQRLGALDERLAALRRDQRAQTARLQQADATNRVLRDELLGIGQRAALLEDSVSKLADPDRHGAQALRLDEAELLLTLGLQRLQIAGDLDGARRAYALAAGVLAGIDDPAYLSLRQTLGQERSALDAVGAEPRVQALAKLDALAATFAAAPARDPDARSTRVPWWRRAFAKVIAVQPSDRALAMQPAERAAALAGLQLEITLARAAAERRDADGYRAALARAQDWLPRLWSDPALLQRRRAQLDAIAAMPLSLSLPALGSTLEQLRQMRASS